MKIRNLTRMSIFIALICVASYISFPIPFTPVNITAQTIIINLAALILTPKESFIVILLYILLGSFGLPVFSGGAGGFDKVVGPTGGFILGFLIMAPVISYLKGKTNNLIRYILVTILVGMPILYFFGVIVLSRIQNISIISALSLAVIPFILGDIFKCILSSCLAVRLNKILKD